MTYTGIRIIEDANMTETIERTVTRTRSFSERWILPIIHPATVPFEPWRTTEEVAVTITIPSRKVYEPWPGIIICHNVMTDELKRHLKSAATF